MFRTVTIAILTVGVLLQPRLSVAQCLQPASFAMQSAAADLSQAVQTMEDDRSDTRSTKPSVLLKISRVTDVTLVAGVAPAPLEDLVKKAQQCLDHADLESRIRQEAQDDVRFVVGDQFADVLNALKRVEQVGLGNIDADARNVLRVRDINYLVYVRPRVEGRRGGGVFNLDLALTLDIVSVESGAIRSERPSLANSTIMREGVKLVSGEVAQLCGCHGPVMLGAERPNLQCESGVEVVEACPALCFNPMGQPMGQMWGTRCK